MDTFNTFSNSVKERILSTDIGAKKETLHIILGNIFKNEYKLFNYICENINFRALKTCFSATFYLLEYAIT